MEQNKKYLVFDAYVFGIRNIFAYIRPLFLMGLLLATIFIGIVLSGIGSFMKVFPELRGLPPTAFLWAYVTEYMFYIPIVLIELILWAAFMVAFYANYGLLFFDEKATQKIVVPSFMKIIKISIVFTVRMIVGIIGLACFIVPGIYWGIRTVFVDYAILDENVGILEAFKKSFSLTKGHGWMLFAYVLTVMVITGKGLVLILPITFFAGAYLYRSLQKKS